jgi:hypothetical protein
MFLWNRARPVRRADNRISSCQLIVYKMCDSQHLTVYTLHTSAQVDKRLV